MAYVTYLASVPEDQVRRLASDPSRTLDASVTVVVSHLIAYWVEAQPLGRLLGEAVDGGRVLGDAFWHPLRPPGYHPPDRVASLLRSLSEAWEQAVAEHPLPAGDWYRVEIEKVLTVFCDAAGRGGHCVVSVLGPPSDPERASRVRIPLGTEPPTRPHS
jgi:hypothetical protein